MKMESRNSFEFRGLIKFQMIVNLSHKILVKTLSHFILLGLLLSESLAPVPATGIEAFPSPVEEAGIAVKLLVSNNMLFVQ